MKFQLDVDTVKLAMPQPELDAWGSTHVGMKRRENQDQFLVADLAKALEFTATSLAIDTPGSLRRNCGRLMLVADGMGGHNGGEVASSLVARDVVQGVLETRASCSSPDLGEQRDFERELVSVLEASQRKVEKAQVGNPSLARMGTTLTLGYVVWPRLYIAHVGDSRCYLLRGDRLEQLTTDHNVAQRMVEDGLLEPAEAARSPYRHVLWNVVGGGSSELGPEVLTVGLEHGDTVLLCSDGLTTHVTDDLIRDVLMEENASEAACRRLEEAALDGGGSDNISIIVCGISNVR